MNLKFSEILVVLLALGAPIAFFVIMLTPGARETVQGYLLAPENRWTVFGGAAGLLVVVMMLRFFNRMKSDKSQRGPASPQLADFFWRSRRK